MPCSIMDRLYQLLREYPALAGIGMFCLISAFLAVLLGRLMLQAGVSLKPLVFLFGFIAIVAVPQAVVHGLDVLAHRKAVVSSRPPAGVSLRESPGDASDISPVAGRPRPVGWEVVFGDKVDPALIIDARPGLGFILEDALEARIGFQAAGGSALAARFASAAAAEAALQRYGAFFQFSEVRGSEAGGWTGKRHAGQGEWNHVVVAGQELYAWTGPTREGVEAERVRVLGPLPAGGPGTFPASNVAVGKAGPSRTQVSGRLRGNTPVMAAFLAINVVLAAGWFFRGSAWAARVSPPAHAPGLERTSLEERLRSLPASGAPMEVEAGPDDRTWEIRWRLADARWLDLMRVHQVRRTHKLVLKLDEARRTVRVREYWSAFDASAGADGVRLEWKAATGLQFFQVDHRRVFGAQLDAEGRPTGELSKTFTFDLQAMKAPAIEAVTGAGWTWQPVVWDAPAALRWLTE